MTTRQYIYKIIGIVKITDGDTYWLVLDVGFRQSQLTNIRLAGWDTPERNKGSEFERSEARRATAEVMDFFTPQGDLTFWVRTEKDPEVYGRWLGDVWAEGWRDHQWHLGAHLAAYDLATEWPTRWREVFDRGQDQEPQADQDQELRPETGAEVPDHRHQSRP